LKFDRRGIKWSNGAPAGFNAREHPAEIKRHNSSSAHADTTTRVGMILRQL